MLGADVVRLREVVSSSGESLAVAGAVGDGKALSESEFTSLYNASSRALGAYLLRVTGDREVARDLVQESYLKLLRARPVAGSRAELSGYLYRIATRLVYDRWRAKMRDRRWRESLPLGGEGAGPAPEMEIDVAKVFGKLRPQERAILWLAYVEGRSHAEIAKIVDARPSSIRVLLFRARKKAAAALRRSGRHQGAKNDG